MVKAMLNLVKPVFKNKFNLLNAAVPSSINGNVGGNVQKQLELASDAKQELKQDMKHEDKKGLALEVPNMLGNYYLKKT